jgi:hypothetical protein
MGDDAEEFEDYDPAKFRRKLKDKRALRGSCPCCGVTDWGTPGDGLFTIPGTVSEAGVEHRVPVTMECAPIICNNCDFVRFHMHGLVMGNMLPK